MRIVFFGTPTYAGPSLVQLLEDPTVEVAAVVTQPDKRRGRGSGQLPSPVKQVALEAALPVWQPRRIKRDVGVLAQLRAVAADAFVVVAYGQILSPEILDMPRLGAINAHGSLLPAYRGAAPIQWCLYHGETETGVTTMAMDAGMDTGAMMLKASVPIGLLDNALDLAKTLAELSADLLQQTLQRLQAETVPLTAQDEAQATYAPLIQKEDYVLDWRRPALALHNQVRGFYPNSVTGLRGQPLKVMGTVPLGADYWPQLPEPWQSLPQAVAALRSTDKAPPGEIIGLLKGYGPVVQTGDGWLLLAEVKPSGKRAQAGWDFVNGSRLAMAERLGPTA
ncbi:Methionyl-tRNA formyltransferase [Halomicronema hongdechloris C2206]|uniref:Methionyl-tRNA formyltransferase n=1 Tax=Halomicronema hongdechloris C2206 TaxID=1641165 RepID=A0A1Z3HLH9_9CYAN|nr:methionyl-tRNA formyltransferase [Halomicronema hongdechloris]ASC71179.1 Methionyl-tRNA formyltransferase [Halomicronema hongdechloris C2206]